MQAEDGDIQPAANLQFEQQLTNDMASLLIGHAA